MQENRSHLVAAALIVVALAVVYLPVLDRDLHSPDERLLVRVGHIHSPADAGLEFVRPEYREPMPLALLFLRAQQLLAPDGGASPFTGTNLVLHALNTMLLLALLRRREIGAWPAGLFAAAFALHPVQVEAVARIASQGELLATGFVLLALNLQVRMRSGFEFAALACLVAGAAASPAALLLPVLLVFTARPRENPHSLTPLFVASGLIALLLHTRTDYDLARWDPGVLDHLHHFGSAIFLSLTDLTAPYWLSPLHVVEPPVAAWAPPVAIAFIALCMWAGARDRKITAGAWWMLAALCFAGLRGVGHITFRADSWLAFALIGLIWTLMARFGGPGRFRRVVAIVVIAFWALISHGQASRWDNEHRLLDHTIRMQPTNWSALVARAELAMINGNTEATGDDAMAAILAEPRATAAVYLLGYARGIAGDEYALQRLSRFDPRAPEYDPPGIGLGYLFLDIGFDAEARTLLQRSDDDMAHAGLALAAARLGDREAASQYLAEARESGPASDEVRLALARLLGTAPEPELSDPEEALRLVEVVAQQKLQYRALDIKAAALARLDQFPQAYGMAQSAANHAELLEYPSRAAELRRRALLYLGSEIWTEPRDSAPAADTPVDEQRDQEDDGRRAPGDG